MSSILIFVHVPKTAGTTFLKILSNNYPVSQTFTIKGLQIKESLHILKNLANEEKAKLKLIKGHLTWNIHKSMPHSNHTYITFLREPIDHFISTYYYIKRTKAHNYYELVNKMSSIDEYIDFRLKNNQDNLQTRHLSESATDMDYNPINYSEAGEKYFQVAKDNLLNKIQYVFLTEEFDEALIYLKYKLGWKNIFYKSSNVTVGRPSKDKFSKETMEKIRQLCIYDLKLYEIAKEKFNAEKKELNKDWEKELSSFSKKNKSYNQIQGYFDKAIKMKNRLLSFIK